MTSRYLRIFPEMVSVFEEISTIFEKARKRKVNMELQLMEDFEITRRFNRWDEKQPTAECMLQLLKPLREQRPLRDRTVRRMMQGKGQAKSWRIK